MTEHFSKALGLLGRVALSAAATQTMWLVYGLN